jgi:hypothetical protein
MSTNESQSPAAGRRVGVLGGTSGKVSAGLVALIALPVVAVGALLLCLGGDRVEPRDHDDPIVIDNPEIDIYRKSETHADPGSAGGNTWTLRRAYPTKKIRVISWEDKDTGYIKTVDVNTPAFDVHVVKNRKLEKSFTVTFKRVGNDDEAIVTPIDGGTFSKKNGEPKKLTPTGGNKHIGQITFGNTSICVANGAKPTVGACKDPAQEEPKAPFALTVELCSNKNCTLTR